MKPILEWYEQLPEPYRSQATENYDDNRILKTDSLTDAIWGGFMWDFTEQGHEYWEDVYRRAQRGEFDTPLTKLHSLIAVLEKRQEQFNNLI